MRRPTILDVAERAGVSKSLVSLVMREPDRVSDASRNAVLQAAEELGYRPNAAARSLVQQRSHVVGVVLADLHNPFFADVADGIESAAGAAGYSTMLASGFFDPQRERAALDTFLELRVDVLVVIGSMLDLEDLERLARSAPLTLVGRFAESGLLDCVGVDDVAGATKAIDHLVGLGHTEIALIHAKDQTGAQGRRRGYETAMIRHGLERSIRCVPGDFTEAGGRRAMTEIIESGDIPTAVFAPNDFSALGAMDAIDSAGMAIPGDISLVGYDDLTISGLPRISLTTVGQPRAELGEQAVQLALERLNGERDTPRNVVVPPLLVVRSTTGPPRS